ncbi:MAG: hypothetical protein V3U75_04180 [Methylococcaceae bacterium]
MAKKKVKSKQTVVEGKAMAKMVTETEKGEQGTLPTIDVLTEDTKPILPPARKYYGIIRERLAIQKKEADALNVVRETMLKSNLLPNEKGDIVFVYREVTVVAIPQEAKIKVTIKE